MVTVIARDIEKNDGARDCRHICHAGNREISTSKTVNLQLVWTEYFNNQKFD